MASASIYLPGANTESAEANVVPDAAVRGAYLFTGGVAGLEPDGTLSSSPETQANRVYERIDAILEAAKFRRDDIAHWFVWSPVRLSNIKAVNPKWAEWFPHEADRPARHALARDLGPNVDYRIEIVGVSGARRKSYEIDGPYHTGGSGIPHFMPFGTTMGDVLFTGPTYGMDGKTFKLGSNADEQAELCARCNAQLYAKTGHTLDTVAQMFVWYNDDASKAAAMRYTDVLFPDPADRPAIHYVDATLPGGNFISGQLQSGLEDKMSSTEVEKSFWQFLVQYDIIAVGRQRRKQLRVPGTVVLDGGNGAVPAGVSLGDLAFTSVILGTPAASIEGQIEKAFAGALATLASGGFSTADVGHVYVWYRDHALREAVDRVWKRVFSDPQQRPARHSVIGALPPGADVGVELTAAR